MNEWMISTPLFLCCYLTKPLASTPGSSLVAPIVFLRALMVIQVLRVSPDDTVRSVRLRQDSNLPIVAEQAASWGADYL
jgi:hypothetical protein